MQVQSVYIREKCVKLLKRWIFKMEKPVLFTSQFIHWIHKEDKCFGKVKSVLFIEYTIFRLSQASHLRTDIYHPRFPGKFQCFC